MITQDQLKDVLERADALNRYLEIDKKKIEYEEEDLRTQAPDSSGKRLLCSKAYCINVSVFAQSYSAFICKCVFKSDHKVLVGEGSGTPLEYSCQENPRDGGAW